MAYKIIYGEEDIRSNGGPGWGRILLTGGFFAVFLALVECFWPEGRELLKALLIPGDPDVTMEAVQVFAQELGCGFSLRDAASNFCTTVLEHGYPG